MKAAIVTIALLLVLPAIWLGVDYASKAHDRRIQQLWRDEDALIRAKQIERERNPVRIVPPADIPKKPGQRDA